MATRGLRQQLPIPADGMLMPVSQILPASFETGEIGIQTVYFPQPVRLERVRLSVTKALAATDAGTVVVKNSAGTTLATLTVPLSSAINTNVDSGLLVLGTGGNVVINDFITLTTAKTTAGGKVNVSLETSAQR